MQVEQSQMSRSQSEIASNAFRRQLVLGQSSKMDLIFPLVDNLAQHTKLPFILTTLVTVYFYLQVIYTSLWPVSAFWDGAGQIGDILDIFREIFWFIGTRPPQSRLLIVLLVLAALFVISFGIILIALYRFKTAHRFETWLLYCARIVLEVIAPVLFHPAAALTGSSIQRLAQQDEPEMWAFIIFSVIFFAGYIFLFWTGFSLSCCSACLNVTGYSMYDPKPLIIIALVSSGIVMLMYVVSLIDEWVFYFLQVAHALVCCLLLYLISYMPFHLLLGSVLTCSTLFTAMCLDICIIIFTAIGGVPSYAPLIVLLIGFVASSITFTIFFNLRTKKIHRDLTYDSYDEEEDDGDEIEMTDEDKISRFMSLKLNRNERKALMYFRIGFQKMSDMFIDWSLMRFIVQTYQTNTAIAGCIQILALFPGESRQLNTLFINLTNKRDLSFIHRFLIYQVYRIKTLRQSSVSSDANEKLAELKRLSMQCESDINGYWLATEASIGYFEMIAADVTSLNALWQEAIRDYPNNSKFSDEYCRFLTECATDFDAAIYQKQRSELIEMGTNFSIDLSFRSMVKQYPDYIKKGIIDFKGNVKSRSKSSGKSGSSNKSSGYSSNTNIEIDVELENSLGRMLFKQSKLRIALHHSIKDRTLFTIDITPLAGIFAVIVSLAAYIGLFCYYKIEYEERGTSMQRLSYISSTRFYYGITNVAILMDYLNQTERSTNYAYYDSLMLEEDEDKSRYLYTDRPPDELIMNLTVRARDSMSSLLLAVADLSSQGTNVYSLASQLFSNIVNITACFQSSRLESYSGNLKSLIVLGFYAQGIIAGQDKTDLFLMNDYCEIIANWYYLQLAVNELFSSFSEDQVSRGNDLKEIGELLMIIIPIALFLLTWLPLTLSIIFFFGHINKFSRALFELDKSVKEEAKLPIRRDNDDDNMDSAEPKYQTSVGILIILMVFLISAVLTVICVLMTYFATNCNELISSLNRYEYYAAQRLTLVPETLHQALLVSILNGSIDVTFTDRTRQNTLTVRSLDSLKTYNNNLLKGTATMDPCIGFDDLLDEYNFKDPCTNKTGRFEIHNLVKCASATQSVDYFVDMIQDIINNPDIYDNEVSSEGASSLVHLCNVHLWRRLLQALNRIVELGSIEYDNMVSTLLILMIIGIIVSLLTFCYALYTQMRMKLTFSSVKTLIKKIPPLQIVNNKRLLNLLMNRETIKKDDESSVNSTIIRHNLDGILCTGITGVVEIVNPAVTTILGYTPEQLLGQPMKVFFTEKEAEKIDKQLTLMKNGQSASTYEDHTICITDSTSEVHCHITILGMNNSHNVVDSFVFILRDETELLQHQKDAEEAKAQSENLLYQILPRSIVTRINQGEKDISFSVPSATIGFIDIVKFSEYAALLTPEQIMGNLSTVFAAFDKILEKYPLVIKIKLIGDVYMYAGGLFTPEEPPQNHAEQVLRFSLDCLTELDEINVKLNANLCVRIGVNSGGPLIAGVLGTDKPVFDIIGDPINVAARLQSTDIPGKVQIPQSTYDLVSGMNFDIEERGEVFLKGKGKTFAYIVKPFNIFMAQMSSSSEFSKPVGIGSTQSGFQLLSNPVQASQPAPINPVNASDPPSSSGGLLFNMTVPSS